MVMYTMVMAGLRIWLSALRTSMKQGFALSAVGKYFLRTVKTPTLTIDHSVPTIKNYDTVVRSKNSKKNSNPVCPFI